MNGIGCEVIKDLLPLYVDDICSEDSKKLVAEHLKGCEACSKEYDQFTRAIPIEQSSEKQTVMKGISKRWKRDMKRAFIIGIVSILLILFGLNSFAQYLYKNPVPVSIDNVEISNLSELKNGNIFFTMEVADRICVLWNNWRIRGDAAYITVDSLKYNILNRKSAKYEDFGTNSIAKSNWMFNVKRSGINKIYYCTKLPESEDVSSSEDYLLIWSNDMTIAEADSTIQTYVKTYSCFGNEEVGTFSAMLYAMKNPYIADDEANSRIMGTLNIVTNIGSYQDSIQASEEPYGWTFEFKNFVSEAEEDEFNDTMNNYACILLAIVGNLGEVTWTYTMEDGMEQKEMTLTAERASDFLGEDIKDFSESRMKVQELLFAIGMELSYARR